jgi:hypothetical protein
MQMSKFLTGIVVLRGALLSTSDILNDCMKQLASDPRLTVCHFDPCFSQQNDLLLNGLRISLASVSVFVL